MWTDRAPPLMSQASMQYASSLQWSTMARVIFTANIQRHIACPDVEAAGNTVRAVLEVVFAANPLARGYVLDDQGALRRHISVYVDGRLIADRIGLSDPVTCASRVHVFQALSGG